MIGKKGVEGLPLKYLVIALVGSLTVGIALQMTGVLRKGVMTGMGIMNQSMTEKIEKGAGINKESLPGFTVDWNFNNNGVLEFNIYNTGTEDRNITDIRATFKGETKNRTGNFHVGNTEGEKRSTGDLEITGLPEEETGERISISFSIGYLPVYENQTQQGDKTYSYGVLTGEVESQ